MSLEVRGPHPAALPYNVRRTTVSQPDMNLRQAGAATLMTRFEEHDIDACAALSLDARAAERGGGLQLSHMRLLALAPVLRRVRRKIGGALNR